MNISANSTYHPSFSAKRICGAKIEHIVNGIAKEISADIVELSILNKKDRRLVQQFLAGCKRNSVASNICIDFLNIQDIIKFYALCVNKSKDKVSSLLGMMEIFEREDKVLSLCRLGTRDDIISSPQRNFKKIGTALVSSLVHKLAPAMNTETITLLSSNQKFYRKFNAFRSPEGELPNLQYTMEELLLNKENFIKIPNLTTK